MKLIVLAAGIFLSGCVSFDLTEKKNETLLIKNSIGHILTMYPNVGNSGIEATLARNTFDNTDKSSEIVIYLVFDSGVNGSLVLRALDVQDKEIGRSLQRVNVSGNHGAYFSFAFGKELSKDDIKSFTLDFIEK